LLLLFALPAWAADCQNAAPLNLGQGVTCIWGNSNTGIISTTGTSSTLTHTFTNTNQAVLFGYYCLGVSSICAAPADWQANHAYANGTIIMPTSLTFNPCGYGLVATSAGTNNSGGSEPTFSSSPCPSSTSTVSDFGVTWTLIKLTIQDSGGSTISCFNYSNNSPLPPQSVGGAVSQLQQWGAYCANLPSGITGIKITCGNSAYCAFVSIFAYEFTGMCTTGASCIVSDGQNAVASTTSFTVSATGTTTQTNELVIGLMGNINDEPLTATNGCLQVDQQFAANEVVAKVVNPAGVTATCGSRWTGSDTGGGTVLLLQTAASAAPPASAAAGGSGLLTRHAGSGGGTGATVLNSHLARSFNGTSTDSMHSAAALILGGPSVISIGFKAYNTTNSTSSDALFMESSTNYNSVKGAVLVDPNSGASSGNCAGNACFEFAVNTTGAGNSILDCFFPQASQAAYHTYLLVMDITSSTGVCKAFVDGSSVTVTTNHGAGEAAGTFADLTWYFMSRNDTSLNNNGRMTNIAIWQADESANAANLNACTSDTAKIDNTNQLFYWPILQVSPETPNTGITNLTVRGTSNIAGPC
jgi:hypothetical protein